MNETLTLVTNADRELALGRLIDDELTAAQERELLKHLDAQPELWRHCALGFLEERALRRGARGWVKAQDIVQSSTPLAAPVSSGVIPREARAEPVAPAGLAGHPIKKQRTWLDYATIAAGLLLAFTGGLIVQQYQARPLPKNMPLAKDQTPAPPGPPSTELPAPTTLAKVEAPSNLRLQYVSHEGQPSDKEIEVPLIPVSKVDESMLASWEQAARQTPIPAETKRLLEQEGQVVRQLNTWITVDLPNGKQALVPVQRIVVESRDLWAQ